MSKGVVVVFFPRGGGLFPIVFMMIFLLIIGIIVVRAVQGISRWQSNNHQPVLTVPASVVTKRTEVHRHTTNSNGQVMNSNSNSYFVTFQCESGDRLELKVRDSEYGLLAEGDMGELTFQGSRFHAFTRT